MKRVKKKVLSSPKVSGTSNPDSDSEDTTPPRREHYKKKKAGKQQELTHAVKHFSDITALSKASSSTSTFSRFGTIDNISQVCEVSKIFISTHCFFLQAIFHAADRFMEQFTQRNM